MPVTANKLQQTFFSVFIAKNPKSSAKFLKCHQIFHASFDNNRCFRWCVTSREMMLLNASCSIRFSTSKIEIVFCCCFIIAAQAIIGDLSLCNSSSFPLKSNCDEGYLIQAWANCIRMHMDNSMGNDDYGREM
jgi:hypothetical protein